MSGIPIMVTIGDTVYAPYELSVKDFIKYWDDSWSNVLVPFHPEYCYYLFCVQTEESTKYEQNMLLTETYQQAYDSGYFNPTSSITIDSFPVNGNPDPFFVSFAGSTLDSIEGNMVQYPFTLSSTSCSLSIWQYATLICLQDTGYNCADGTPLPSISGACEGDLNYYFQDRNIVFFEYLIQPIKKF